MKACKKIFLLVLALIVAMNMNVTYAAEALSDSEVTLKANVTEAKVGDTVTITVSAKCATGIGGLDSVLTWDSSKVEFENEGDFQLSGVDTSTNEFKFSVLYDEEATEADLATLEFKILDTATVGEKLSIKFSKIAIIDNNYEDVNVDDKELTITIVDEEEGEQTPGEGEGEQTPGEGEGTQTPGEGEGTQTPGEGEGTQKPGEGTTQDTNKPIVDNTIANKPINNAGIEKYAFAIILIASIVIALYIKNKKYSDII